MKILIVDDEKPARDRLARMVGELKQHDLVGEAVNGLEALGMAQSLEPDIVLLDIRMPGMDGIEAARHIAKLDQPPAVVFTTAFSDHALEAFETHAVDYLLKPVKQDRLQAAMDAAIRPTRAQASKSGALLSGLEPRQHNLRARARQPGAGSNRKYLLFSRRAEIRHSTLFRWRSADRGCAQGSRKGIRRSFLPDSSQCIGEFGVACRDAIG